MPGAFTALRIGDGPIIYPELCSSIGDNIQGPSLIKVPSWVPDPLGRYYLYFADHKGSYIRLAYADEIIGPWTIHQPGSLHLSESGFLREAPLEDTDRLNAARQRIAKTPYPHDIRHDLEIPHIASPDVHIDHAEQRILMYYHGLESYGLQLSRVALSDDGVNFKAKPNCISKPYLRVFQHQNYYYGLTMPGQFYRSENGLEDFEAGPTLFSPNLRHCAVMRVADELNVFYTDVGDTPERIKHTVIQLLPDWNEWQMGPTSELLRPEQDWEGATHPLEPSMRSVAYGVQNQLRDPGIFVEGDVIYLLYAVGGEAGIAVARLDKAT